MKQAHSYQQEVDAQLRFAKNILATCEVIQDPKMLLPILSHIHNAQQHIVNFFSSFILNNQNFNYEKDLLTFISQSEKHNLITHAEAENFQSVNGLITKFKESPIVFSRKESYVISDSDYDLSLLTKEVISQFMNSTEQVAKRVFG